VRTSQSKPGQGKVSLTCHSPVLCATVAGRRTDGRQALRSRSFVHEIRVPGFWGWRRAELLWWREMDPTRETRNREGASSGRTETRNGHQPTGGNLRNLPATWRQGAVVGGDTAASPEPSTSSAPPRASDAPLRRQEPDQRHSHLSRPGLISAPGSILESSKGQILYLIIPSPKQLAIDRYI
jgi:hypothetical protein